MQLVESGHALGGRETPGPINRGPMMVLARQCHRLTIFFVSDLKNSQPGPINCGPMVEIDILVSKLLGFETFAKSLRVSVSENLVSEKKYQFRFRKNLVSEKSLGFGTFGLEKKKSK